MQRRHFALQAAAFTCAGIVPLRAAPARRTAAPAVLSEALGTISRYLMRKPDQEAVARAVLESLKQDGVRSPHPDVWRASGNPTDAVFGAIGERTSSRAEAEALVWRGLHGGLQRLDPYSDAMPPAAFRAYAASQQSSYCGVGMDLEKDPSGKFFCFPYGGSPAARAGVSRGAELTAVDGRSITGLSLYEAGALVRGREGAPVRLRFGGLFGIGKEIQILRRKSKQLTVAPMADGSRMTLRIDTFGIGTADEVASELRRHRPSSVILDLRGCRGGDFDAAVAVASLFFPSRTPVVISESTTEGRTIERSAGGGLAARASVHIRQDRATASAAELLVAALTDNNRATSEGPTTYGKGVFQELMPLAAGGALLLTTGQMLTPRTARAWQGQGIQAVG